MRLLPWLACVVMTLAISLASASTVEARNFWQTYGSTMPAADGCGCTWNWNSDYFVARYPSSCRYGLFSPCKTSCTTSPACKWCHPFYPGYCSPYGPCHYRRRNHVYACRCGCAPIAACLQRCRSNRACCCAASGLCAVGCAMPGCLGSICTVVGNYGIGNCGPTCEGGVCYEPAAPLYHIEPEGFELLGSIPVDSTELLTRTDLSQLGTEGGDPLLQAPGVLQQLQELLPAQSPNLPQFNQSDRD
ncbi:MAG: hypothetical protein AAGD11_12855 [Planctomycetota bacterium]